MLIEILVVVLIIGILAAMAVPKYQKAVIKSRYATLKHLTKSLLQSQQLYYMANGSYTTSFEDLDFEVSGGRISANDTSLYVISDVDCKLQIHYVFCKNEKIKMSYIERYTGEKDCVAYCNGSFFEQTKSVGMEETQKDTPSIEGASYDFWYTY